MIPSLGLLVKSPQTSDAILRQTKNERIGRIGVLRVTFGLYVSVLNKSFCSSLISERTRFMEVAVDMWYLLIKKARQSYDQIANIKLLSGSKLWFWGIIPRRKPSPATGECT